MGRKSLYSVHPGVQTVQDWIVSLPGKTGRSLEQWLALIRKEGPPDVKARRDWLEAEHKLGTNSAWWLADRADGKGTEDGDPDTYLQAAEKYVEDMYSGAKAALRPIFDALLKLGLSIGKDAKACPCQTIVPLYRNHVFAQIKPTTRTRIDLGFSLKGQKPPARFIDTGGAAKGDRITHRVPIEAMKDIDAEIKKWLKIAYDLDAK